MPIGAEGFPVFNPILEAATFIELISFKPVGMLLTIMPTLRLFTSDKVKLFETIREVEVFVRKVHVFADEMVIGPNEVPVGVSVDVEEANADQVPVEKLWAELFKA